MSRCTPETARGRHVFEIAGYSLVRGLGIGNYIRSGTFSVGGYDWCIQYYPDGNSEDSDSNDWDTQSDEEDDDADNDEGYISVFLTLLSKDARQVRALCDLRLVNPATGLSPVMCYSNKKASGFSGEGSTWGSGKFKLRSELEASEYLRDDCLMIQCDLSVITGMPVSQSEPISDI
ncbi:BTB/POZ and MATH domain-containing protein 6 [Dichanthelium oligosanthes]|uniref:BTB/POZ and MATH domain-containing protein 6 n=1 Tax=Dichanthelium oligosanthes TaxID=888268 RepID=A0A1E5VZY3_9POAL|nr:BTB/POZ and MATH domain-containing protein 6 [Dichanthelium oligosanthes]